MMVFVIMDGAESPDTIVTWTSADESIATVDESGYVTGVAVGETTITASLNNATGAVMEGSEDTYQTSSTCNITVGTYEEEEFRSI